MNCLCNAFLFAFEFSSLTLNGCFSTSEDKRGHLVEWVEKTSFERICWLLSIDTKQRRHQLLLTLTNSLDVYCHLKCFVQVIIMQRTPQSLVHREHFMIKDIINYKKAHAEELESKRLKLDEIYRKRKEGTLCQT